VDNGKKGFAFAVQIDAKGLRLRRREKRRLALMVGLMSEQENLIGAQCPSEVRFIFREKGDAIRGRNVLKAVGVEGGAIYGVSVDGDGIVTMEGD
jgi:hypothetical protein